MIDPKSLIETLSLEELCQTAEEYFQTLADPTPLLAKPFSSIVEAPVILQQMGLLLSGLKLGKTMTVLDFGAGTCWFSRLLSQLQCRPIACDPSATALELGKQLFVEHPIVGEPIAEPEFLLFDGRKIDLPDESVDRIICFGSFHHVPNQQEVVAEFGRVLKSGGIVGFGEPGRHHSQTPQSQSEMKNFNVLENDILVEEIFEMAQAHGFTDISCKVMADMDISLAEYKSLTGQGWNLWLNGRLKRHIRQQVLNQSVFFLYKGFPKPDSRNHVGLAHHIEIVNSRYSLEAGEMLNLPVTITNAGEAVWLVDNIQDIGVVKIGTHLYDESGKLLEFDFSRHRFERPIYPNERVQAQVDVSFPQTGTFKLVVDLVSENICWFENVGSTPLEVWVDVH